LNVRVAEHWFERRKLTDDVTHIWEPHVVPLLRCNIWHIRGRDRDLIVDTGMGVASLRDFARDIIQEPVSAVATHVHIDHIGCHHEFDDCIVHRLEAAGLQKPAADHTLAGPEFDPENIATLHIPPMVGYDISGPMLTAIPTTDFDLKSFLIKPAAIGRTVEDGDVIDIGDRVFEVLHLPGHSPGGIGLWEVRTQTLFSGDTVYDGPLIDTLHHSSISDYIESLYRLKELPVRTIHAGHDPSFGRDRLIEIVDQQLLKWSAVC
jgi:glyoxylase-like metal-dependent hydrolase (beta-lactamase superfamily II)